MALFWLDLQTPFPPPELALKEPDGLLACGGDLSMARMTSAYQQGIFPWYSEPQPILWWSPSQRMVLMCKDFVISHSLKKKLRQIAKQETRPNPFIQIKVDTAFVQVMQACAAPRQNQAGTWISQDIINAYTNLHLAGLAHSIETWIDGKLAGGLYGVSMGKMFYGESMFSNISDSSKIALAYAVFFLARHGVEWIDCQQQTRHLGSLGAAPVSRRIFMEHLKKTIPQTPPPWQAGILHSDGNIS
ncbi:leucyl/phenylalanyl-tRNA--protein transferase [Advenella faeciporci]|uniref:Leucyl/phenylalanyl-tRNA--protein transferase n=1 Tax=Advenella faeciporci TaxID=797535 RepID=A0A918MZV0_9BURK|nr:leucyl/phenylalanyl-tRNA--protein transferase [Advenella faeciporci]GGW90575.1 leucyl/phenylalanyl-tRNA--protein transferase [Advenella faeciporci]